MPSSRIVARDQDITRINSTATESEGIRLRKVEAAARGFDLGQGDVSVLENCRLPHLLVGQHGASQAWPLPQKPIALALPSTFPRRTESLIQTKTNFMRWCTTKMPATSSCTADAPPLELPPAPLQRTMREQILDQQAEDGKQHDVMVAGHQERERRRERLNSAAAERAHEAATRRRKIESGAE